MPAVQFGGFALALISHSNTQIVAVLPPLVPQTYLLQITRGGSTANARFEVTIESGDISAVIAGLGLSGGGQSGDATLTVDKSAIQARVSGTCPAGSSIQSIDVAGSVVCEPDDVGAGASLGANTFTGTQTINAGHLDLDPSTATTGNITKNGVRFLHNIGDFNTFLGVQAGDSLTIGGQNVAVGTAALRSNTSGSVNTAVGSAVMLSNTSGQGNTAVGIQALANNTVGSGNTGLGRSALHSNIGHLNVAVGDNAGRNGTSGSNNIYLGASVLGVAGESSTMYLGNVGTQTTTFIAGVRGTNVTGGEMVVIDTNGRLGSAAVATGTNTVGSAQVIDDSLSAGDLAPNAVTGSELASDSVTAEKVAFNYAVSTSEGGAASDVACIGCVAASEVNFSFAGGGANTFSATQTIDTGNVDLDPSTSTSGSITKNGARFIHDFGSFNTFVGRDAGNFSMSGSGLNTGVGFQALAFNTTGNGNTAGGYTSLSRNTEGSGNTAMGTAALQGNTTGSSNTAVGYLALQLNLSGVRNTALGHGALNSSTGGSNIAVGMNAGANVTTGSNNIYLGTFVLGVPGESNTMYLGQQGQQNRTLIAGIRGSTTTNADAIPVMIDSAGQLGTVSSSRRFKDDILDMGEASRRVLQLRPVTFRYKQPYGNGAKPVQYGLIAEEVAHAFPELAVRSRDGSVETVHYEKLSVLLLNELQRQEQQLRRQAHEIQRQRERMDALERQLSQLAGAADVR